MSSKQFLAVGDYLINPELLAYAVLEPDPRSPVSAWAFPHAWPTRKANWS